MKQEGACRGFFDTVTLDEAEPALVIIDQTLLPGEVRYLRLHTKEEIWDAIRELKVRGAPAIGVAAAYGIYIVARSIDKEGYDEFRREFHEAVDYLSSSRPTAVNLTWALSRMTSIVDGGSDVTEVMRELLGEARRIQAGDIETCRMIGEYGLSLLRPGMGLITHCNAGSLATSQYGTATAPMYLGHERGYGFRVFCDETRPLLQGARLTSYELATAGLDVTLICDSMAATVMGRGMADAVLVGCDRVAANGDTANKIGTLPLAIAARHFGIPFYVCAPTSTIDMKTPTGARIEIEERAASEITDMWYKKRMAPDGIKVFNPAFDVTDARLISAFITERGVVYPPFTESIARVMA